MSQLHDYILFDINYQMNYQWDGVDCRGICVAGEDRGVCPTMERRNAMQFNLEFPVDSDSWIISN